MDRAVVNALHHLYRNGACSMAEVLALLWCGPDTEDAVDDLTEQVGELRRVSPYLNKFIKELEWQLTSLPGAGYVLGNPMSVPARKRGEARPAFAAMPYGPAWFRTVCDVIFACACTTGVALEGSKDISVPGTIRDQI